MQAVRTIKKLFIALFFFILSFLLAIGTYCYYYRAQIIQKFIEEANKKLKTPIHIKETDLSILSSFPNVAIVLKDVVIEDHRTSVDSSLITAKRIVCTFNLLTLCKGQYVFNQLQLEQGKIYLVADHSTTMELDKTEKVIESNDTVIDFTLKKIRLNNIEIVYKNTKKNGQYIIEAKQIRASLTYANQRLDVDVVGKVTMRHMQLKDWIWTETTPVALHTKFRYNHVSKTLALQPSQVKHGPSIFLLQGNWETEKTAFMDLAIKGINVEVQSLLTCFPKQFCQKLHPYQLNGNASFDLRVNKQVGNAIGVQAHFKLNRGTVTHPVLSKMLQLHQVLGHVVIPNVKHLKTATIRVDKLNTTLAHSTLEGSLVLHDFEKLHLNGSIKATLDLPSLAMLFPSRMITEVQGTLSTNLTIDVLLQQLISKNIDYKPINTSGDLHLQSVSFVLEKPRLHINNLTGSFLLNNDVLAINELAGRVGHSDFTVRGLFKNSIPFLVAHEQPIYVDAQLQSNYIDLNELWPHKEHLSTQGGMRSQLGIAPSWVLHLDCAIDQLHFRRFEGRHIQGKIVVKDQKAVTDNITLAMAGGKLSLAGTVDAQQGDLNMYTVAQLEGIYIDSLFYVLENFHQDFLTDRHLKGKLFSDIDLSMKLDKNGTFDWRALEGSVDVLLKNGELNNFEPMQQLAKYVEEAHLARLRFAELKNKIKIKDRTIHIPPMKVHSNITQIQVSGKHSFNKQIVYNFVVPWKNFKKKDKDKIFGEVEDGRLAAINLFLKLQGDIDNYKLSLDTKALKDSLKDALKAQKKVIKEIITGTYQNKKPVQELEGDDHFAFE